MTAYNCGYCCGSRVVVNASPCFLPDAASARRGRNGAFRGAHASGVWFSASRRKPRPANFFAPEIPGIVGDKSSGATPELARETRALPHSCFGVRVQWIQFWPWSEKSGLPLRERVSWNYTPLAMAGKLEHHRSQILSRQSLIVCASLCAANGLVRKLTPSCK